MLTSDQTQLIRKVIARLGGALSVSPSLFLTPMAPWERLIQYALKDATSAQFLAKFLESREIVNAFECWADSLDCLPELMVARHRMELLTTRKTSVKRHFSPGRYYGACSE